IAHEVRKGSCRQPGGCSAGPAITDSADAPGSPPCGDAQQCDRRDDEDSCLNALYWPEPAVGLVGRRELEALGREAAEPTAGRAAVGGLAGVHHDAEINGCPDASA